jgi:hypothetical protein
MLGSLRPILEKLGKFETKLEMFAHPSDCDRFPVSLSVIQNLRFLDELAQNRRRRRFYSSARIEKSARLSCSVKKGFIRLKDPPKWGALEKLYSLGWAIQNNIVSQIKHAMCLFGINEEDEFLFKNTSNETKTVSIPLTACEPKIGYHISFKEIQ